MKRITQKDMIRSHLINIGNLTQKEAIEEYGAYRLSAIIYELRREGLNIITDTFKVVNRYGGFSKPAKYILERK
jgi:hypothetical protein